VTSTSCGPTSLVNASATYPMEYVVPGNCTAPNGITVDGDGRVWFVEQNTSQLVRYDPKSGNFTEYDLPVAKPITWSLTTTLDNDVWLTDANSSEIIRFDPASLNFTQYHLAEGSFPQQIIRGPDGAVWFSELYGHRIGRIQPDNGLLTEYPTPNNDTAPSGIAFDSKGMLWVTMVSSNKSVSSTIATLDPANGTYQYYEMPIPIAQPIGIAVDSSGMVWFAENGSSLIGRFDPLTGGLIQMPTSGRQGVTTTLPYWMAEDPLGNIWFNENGANRVAELNPTRMTLVEYDIPSYVPSYGNISNAQTIAYGAGGLWFTELSTGKIGFVNASVSPDLSVTGPDAFNVSSSTTVQLNITALGNYSGQFSLGATDAEVSGGALQNFSVSFASPAYFLSGKPVLLTVNATVTVTTSTILGDYYFTITAREPGMAASKIVEALLVPPR